MARETRASDAPDPQGGRTPLTEKAKALLAGKVARDKLADDVAVLDVTRLTTVAEFLVICSGESARQVKAVANAIDEVLSSEGVRLLHSEGTEHGQWILLDYGDVVVHVFHREARQFYRLDHLWGDAPRVPLPAEQPAERRHAARGLAGAPAEEAEPFRLEG